MTTSFDSKRFGAFYFHPSERCGSWALLRAGPHLLHRAFERTVRAPFSEDLQLFFRGQFDANSLIQKNLIPAPNV